jgi:hypothetical protein
MLHHLSSARWMSLCSAVLLAACGGSGGGAGAPTAPTPTTTLSVSPSSLALSVNSPGASSALTGLPRSFTIKNVGTETAQSVIYAVRAGSPALGGTTLASNCATLAPGATCTITVTPGGTASATPGDTNPVPITLSVGGLNTNLLAPTVHVLTHGSVYQDGYVFAIDDTSSNTASVGGKVAALSDSSSTSGMFWSAGAGGAVARDNVPGVSDDSTPPLPSCAGNVDGKCNTDAIERQYPATLLTEYAAGLCQGATLGGHIDWYLPSTCELSGSRGAVACPASQQSIQTELVDNFIAAGGLPSADYWSSTQGSAGAATASAWGSLLQQTTGTSSLADKGSLYRVRCVRALTPIL